MLTNFFDDVCAAAESLSLDVLIGACWGAFALLFMVTFILCLSCAGVRRAEKRPFFAAVNVFAVVTLAFALTEKSVEYSALLAAVFWCVGYLLYGLIVPVSKKSVRAARIPALQGVPPAGVFTPSVRPAKPNVPTEHAVSVTEKLLKADLGKGDRQEAERIKSALSFLKAKGELTPADNELLNEKFNALLKLMAKYDI